MKIGIGVLHSRPMGLGLVNRNCSTERLENRVYMTRYESTFSIAITFACGMNIFDEADLAR